LFALFIVGIIIAIIAGIAAAAKHPGLGLFVFAAVVALSFVVTGCGTVDTKNVGVVTSFKKPTGETKAAGPYFKAPWKSVTDMSLAWQTVNYQFIVQAAGGATIGLDIRPRWRMKEAAAPELFQDYKDFDGVVSNLFKNELVAASGSNALFGSYNPLTAYDVKTSLPVKSKEAWESELKSELIKRLGTKMEIERVAVITIAPDTASQAKLNGQIEEFGRGKILDQGLVNAEKERLITAKNAQVDKETRCLEIAEKVGGQPGLCLNGNAGVIVDTKK
jgi:SPFH domain / Band 7 family